jgi:arylsulfatase A-like enzyme
MALNVFVVTYRNNFLEDWEVCGVFDNKEAADKLAAELRPTNPKVSDGDYEVEEWEMNKTRVETNVRGLIRNLEKDIGRYQDQLDDAKHTDNAFASVAATREINWRKDIIARLERALSNDGV